MSIPKTCKKCGRRLKVLKEQGIGPYVAYCTNPECSEFQKHVATQGQSSIPLHAFDADLSEQGRQLHKQLLVAARVDEFYQRGCLWGELTEGMAASIHVPDDAWRALSPQERKSLESYAASLIPQMRASPELHTRIPQDAPAFPAVRNRAAALTPNSWVVITGQLRPNEGGSYDILADQIVSAGTRRPLDDGDHQERQPA